MTKIKPSTNDTHQYVPIKNRTINSIFNYFNVSKKNSVNPLVFTKPKTLKKGGKKKRTYRKRSRQ
jgi:hypothetical protein